MKKANIPPMNDLLAPDPMQIVEGVTLTPEDFSLLHIASNMAPLA